MTRVVLALALLGVGCVQELALFPRPDGGPDAGQADAGIDADHDGGSDGAPPDAVVPDGGIVAPRDRGRVAAGEDHTCAILGRSLYCWGANESGQLGLGDREDRFAPTLVGEDFAQVSVAGGHTCGLRLDGSLWCFGNNVFGQLGLGDFEPRTTPARVGLAGAATALSTGYDHACAVLRDGSLWCWGRNEEGMLGQGEPYPERMDSPTPIQVAEERPWRLVSCSDGHACAVADDAALWCWGRNTQSQLGLGADAAQQYRAPQSVAPEFADVSVAQAFSCGIDRDRRLWCWGANGSAQLGLGDRDDRAVPTPLTTSSGAWTDLSIDAFHGCAVRAQEELWCWGRNVEGQLGTGDLDPRLVPTRVAEDSRWTAVAAGRFHTCAQQADGSVWCTGRNTRGELGTSDLERRDALTLVLGVP